MSELVNPDEKGGIEPETNVSFIVIPARRGQQAAEVTIADPPVKPIVDAPSSHGNHEAAPTTSFADLNLNDNKENETPAVDAWPVDLDDPNAW